jgi:hypothetical protein
MPADCSAAPVIIEKVVGHGGKVSGSFISVFGEVVIVVVDGVIVVVALGSASPRSGGMGSASCSVAVLGRV